ncbi:MAG: winged helix-turn-helix domain-containing protein, partial [Rubricella sp.]
LDFDLMIVDVMMPGEDGLSFTRDFRASRETPILLLTAKGEADARVAGLESGADDYLAKPFDPRELALRIGAILRRAARPVEKPEPPKTLHLGAIRYDVARAELWREGEIIRLTATETALMRMLAARPHEPVSRRELIESMGKGPVDTAQERAIDVQVTRLRRKIEDDPKAPRYLQTVRGSGYMLAPD